MSLELPFWSAFRVELEAWEVTAHLTLRVTLKFGISGGFGPNN